MAYLKGSVLMLHIGLFVINLLTIARCVSCSVAVLTIGFDGLVGSCIQALALSNNDRH